MDPGSGDQGRATGDDSGVAILVVTALVTVARTLILCAEPADGGTEHAEARAAGG